MAIKKPLARTVSVRTPLRRILSPPVDRQPVRHGAPFPSPGNKSPDAFKRLFDALTYRELLVLTIKTKACSDLDEEKANVYAVVQLSLETEQANRLQRFLIDQDLLKTFAALDQKTHRKGDN